MTDAFDRVSRVALKRMMRLGTVFPRMMRLGTVFPRMMRLGTVFPQWIRRLGHYWPALLFVVSIVGEKMRQTRIRERRQMHELADLTQLTGLGQFLIRDDRDRIVFWSDGCARLYGFTAEQAVGRVSHELLRTEFPQPLETIRRILRKTGRWEGEQTHRRADGSVVHVASLWVLRNGAANPAVLEVNNDITDRKRAEAALREARNGLEIRVQERTAQLRRAKELVESERQRFQNVLDQLPAYLVLLTPDFHVAFANRFFEERFGRCEGQRCYEHLFHRAEPCVNCAADKVLNVNGPQPWEWTGPDGHDYDIYGFPFTDVDGSPLIMAVGLDITERKRAQEAVRESDERLRFALEACHIGAWDLDLVDHTAFHSLEHDRILGYTEPPPHWTLDDFLQHVLPEYREEVEAMVRAAAAAQRGWTSECRIRRADGQIRWIWFSGRHRTDSSGRSRVVGVVQDITERKRADAELAKHREHLEELVQERTRQLAAANARLQTLARELTAQAEALRQSEQRLSLAQQIAHVGTFDWDMRTGVNVWTPQLEAMYGLPPGGFGKTEAAWERLVHSEDRAKALRLVEQAIDTGEPTEGQWRVVWPDGSLHWLAGRWQVFKDESGKPFRMTGVNIDVTERKRAEEALRESEEKYRTLFDSIDEGFCIIEVILDGDGRPADYRFLEINPAFERQTGLHDARGKLMRELAPDHEAYWFEIYGRIALTGEAARFTNEAKALHRWYDVYAFRVGEPEDRRVAILFNDITAHRQAEQTLAERMKELACLYAVSRNMQEDLSIDELCRRAVEHVVPAMQFPEITAAVIELNGKRFTSENYAEGLSHGLHAAITVEGEVLGHLTVYYAQERPFIVPEEQNLVNGVADALSTWLTRSRAEEALRRSEEQFHRMFEDDLTGDFISTPEGRILLCNPAFAEIFGFSGTQEAVGTNILALYTDPGEREPLLARLKREGKIDRFEVWRKRRDGEPIHIVENLVGHFNDQGELHEIKGYIFEDTKRKRAEEALRELTATLESKVAQRTGELKHRARQLQKLTLDISETEDRERKRMAEILHDDLQQMLAAAKFHLGLMRSRARYDASLQATAAQIDHMLMEAIQKSRNLSHELSPAVIHGQTAAA